MVLGLSPSSCVMWGWDYRGRRGKEAGHRTMVLNNWDGHTWPSKDNCSELLIIRPSSGGKHTPCEWVILRYDNKVNHQITIYDSLVYYERSKWDTSVKHHYFLVIKPQTAPAIFHLLDLVALPTPPIKVIALNEESPDLLLLITTNRVLIGIWSSLMYACLNAHIIISYQCYPSDDITV